MKTRFLGLAAVVLLLTGFIACNENDEIKSDEVEIEEIDDPVDFDFSGIDFSNIEKLCEQPIPVIEKAIRGKWQVVYFKGGFVANAIQYPKDYFVEFAANKKYSETTPALTFTTKIEWSRELRYSIIGDSVYVMRFQNAAVIPILMEEIHNDTLVYHRYQVVDGAGYYCVKID